MHTEEHLPGTELSEQEVIRRQKLEQLQELGIDPYPAALYEITHTAENIKTGYSEDNKAGYEQVAIAGRIMSVRDMGKANFSVIQDISGRIQISIRRDDICPECLPIHQRSPL